MTEEQEKKLNQLLEQNETFRNQLSEAHNDTEALRNSIEESNKQHVALILEYEKTILDLQAKLKESLTVSEALTVWIDTLKRLTGSDPIKKLVVLLRD